MGCFLGCFGFTTKKQKRIKPCNKFQINQKYVPLDSEKENVADSANYEPRDKPKESSKSKVKKKVSFNLDVKTYERIQDDENNTTYFSEEEEKTQREYNKQETAKASMSMYPSSYRYYNCNNSYDEEEDEITLEDSDIDDLDEEEDYGVSDDDDDGGGEEDSLHLETENKYGNVEKMNKDESNEVGRNHRNSVLLPVENLTQWKAVKARGAQQVKHQKENIIKLDGKQELPLIAKPVNHCVERYSNNIRCFFLCVCVLNILLFAMECLTLTGLLKNVAEKFPSHRAISIAGKFDITHARLQELVERAASQLVSAGVNYGDVIALTFPNTIEFVIMFLAVIRVRATAAPLNSAYMAEEFEFYLSDSESKLLLTAKEGNEAAQAAASKLKIPHITVALPEADSDIVFSPAPSESNLKSASEIVNDPSDIGLFLHTSGTTSRPKGVPLSQFNLVSSVKNIKSVYKLSDSDSTVIVLPLFHVHGLMAGLLSSLGAGASVTLPSAGRFSGSTFWSDMKKYNATWYTAVPTIHQILLDRHLSKPEPDYPKLRFIRSCSAALAPSVMARLEEAFGAPVLEAYAMTEATHLMASNPLPEDGPHIPGSVGKPVGQEMAILNENGVVQGPNAKGEVCIRGPNVTKGYKNNPEANKSAFQLGWFHTGDVGYLDSDGYLHLVGRIKELINRGGEKISPIEVDAVLVSHPEIAQAVAFGVPDDKYGEEINCAVIPREGSNIDEAEVLRFCKKNLAAFKVPKKVFMTDSLPKTASGKIQRRLVAEHFLAQISTAKVPKFGA